MTRYNPPSHIQREHSIRYGKRGLHLLERVHHTGVQQLTRNKATRFVAVHLGMGVGGFLGLSVGGFLGLSVGGFIGLSVGGFRGHGGEYRVLGAGGFIFLGVGGFHSLGVGGFLGLGGEFPGLGVRSVQLVDPPGGELSELRLSHAHGNFRVGIAVLVNTAGVADVV